MRLISLTLICLASRATGWCYRSCTSENFRLIRRLRFTRLIRISYLHLDRSISAI